MEERAREREREQWEEGVAEEARDDSIVEEVEDEVPHCPHLVTTQWRRGTRRGYRR
jgi:hypothetical protein